MQLASVGRTDPDLTDGLPRSDVMRFDPERLEPAQRACGEPVAADLVAGEFRGIDNGVRDLFFAQKEGKRRTRGACADDENVRIGGNWIQVREIDFG